MKMNSKGMTLVEVILALTLASIAMLIISTGFISASRILSESKGMTKQTQQQQVQIVEKQGEIEETQVEVEINEKTFIVKGQYRVAMGKDNHMDFVIYERK